MGMGMGMGMGMNSLSMLSLGAMGGMGMASSGPLSWIYSLNYFITSVGHMANIVGMNSHAIMAAYHSAYASLMEIITRVRTSEIRRILQRKCRRSRLFRYLFIVACSGLCGAALKVVHLYWGYLTQARLPYSYGGSGYGSGYGGSGYGGSAYGGSGYGYGYGGGQGQRAIAPAAPDMA